MEHIGSFVKKWYLMRYLILERIKGDMSIVGQYCQYCIMRDISQGQYASHIRGGMLGLGHINKGTEEMKLII